MGATLRDHRNASPMAMPSKRSGAVIGPVNSPEALASILTNAEAAGWEYQSIDYSGRTIVLCHAEFGFVTVEVGVQKKH